MKSLNQRTYSRKRKETAEAKFDALFSDNDAKVSDNENKLKRKPPIAYSKARPVTYEVTKFPNGSQLITLSSAVGSQCKTTVKKLKTVDCETQDAFNSDTHASGVQTVAEQGEKEHATNTSERVPYANLQTKYDALFQRSEKSASDKFDAIFGSTGTGIKSRIHQDNKIKAVGSCTSVNAEPDIKNLFGFAVDDNSTPLTKIHHKSPTELDITQIKNSSAKQRITAATMKTVDGKVVLNIQRGVKNNSSGVGSINVKDNPVVESTLQIPFTGNRLNIMKNAVSDYHTSRVTSSQDNIPRNQLANTPAEAFQPRVSQPKSDASSVDIRRHVFNAPVPVVPTQNYIKVSSVYQLPEQKDHLHARKNSRKKNSRNLLASSGVNFSKPSYNSRPWIPDSEESTSAEDSGSQSASQPSAASDEYAEEIPRLTRSVTWPQNVGESIVTSLKCDRNVKAYYTVVKHVKNYQNCLEEGEAKEFEDEVEYLLDGLQPSQPIPIRCLSATNLSSKCQQHNFRLYLRAHNVSMKIFSNLQDATENKSLALATSALLFMLSRDRQMEVDKLTLQLLLRILDPLEKENANANGQAKCGAQQKSEEKKKYKFFKSKGNSENDKTIDSVETKIKELIDGCGDMLLTGNDVSTKRLASEALLRFTARRTTEWFREEVRLKGGLDHIISLVKIHVDEISSCSSVTNRCERTLALLERILKVLENAIVNSPRNAMYLVTHQRALLLKNIASLLQKCLNWLSSFSFNGDSDSASDVKSYTVLRSCILQIVKLLVNISNDNEWVSTRVGDQDGMLTSIVTCVLVAPEQIREDHRYELVLLSLSLLVNLVEASAKNRMALMKMTVPTSSCDQRTNQDVTSGRIVVEALIKLFFAHESAARDNEILGEEGVKKAVEAKKAVSGGKDSDVESLSGSQRSGAAKERGGRWVETEDGMEWEPSDSADDQSLPGSQESVRSNARNPEAGLTAEEKTEMKETLSKANDHMEHSIVAAYAALVLGCLIHGNRANVTTIRQYLSGHEDFKPMVRMLKKFLTFMKLTAGMSLKGESTLTQIIEDLEEEGGS